MTKILLFNTSEAFHCTFIHGTSALLMLNHMFGYVIAITMEIRSRHLDYRKQVPNLSNLRV